MTVPTQENQLQTEQKLNDKEYNFRALEAKRLEAERRAIEAEKRATEAERIAQEAISKKSLPTEDEDEDDQPYVDHKRLNKKLNRFGQSTQSEIQKAMEIAKQTAKE